MSSETLLKPKYDIKVNFSDRPNENVFYYIGHVAETIRRVGSIDKAAEFTNEVNKADDYEDAKRIIDTWVNVTW